MGDISSEKLAEKSIYSAEIDCIIEQIKKEHSKFEVIKIWPALKEPSNVIFYNPESKKYIKAFTYNKTWKTAYFIEITNINRFNEFQNLQGGQFSWPTILKQHDENLYFIMEDIENECYDKLDFSALSLDDTLDVYQAYRKDFDAFEKSNERLQSTTPRVKISTKDKIFKVLLDYTNPLAKEALFYEQKRKIKDWYRWWKDEVNSFLETDFNFLEEVLKILQGQIEEKLESEFVYNRLWTGHVFSDWTNYKIIDFDSLWYRVKWTEEVALMRTNTLLSVEKYESYEEWKQSAIKWKEAIEKDCWNQKVWKLLIFQKLIGTMYIDYPKWEKGNHTSEEDYQTRKKNWILWVGRLLNERYNIPYVLKIQ